MKPEKLKVGQRWRARKHKDITTILAIYVETVKYESLYTDGYIAINTISTEDFENWITYSHCYVVISSNDIWTKLNE